MDITQYCICLRKELVILVTGIHDAGFSLYWDNTTPNYVTKRKLQQVYNHYLKQAADSGLYLVTRHASCSYKNHNSMTDGETDYVLSDEYGLNASYRDPRYIWDGDQMYQGTMTCPCPCSLDKDPKAHHVIQDIIYSKDTDLIKAKNLYSILSDVYYAIEQSGEKQSRSGIREYLLRAILQLNDMILPVPVEDYIRTITDSSPPQG
jgi:hypothetical protein